MRENGGSEPICITQSNRTLMGFWLWRCVLQLSVASVLLLLDWQFLVDENRLAHIKRTEAASHCAYSSIENAFGI